ncbi:hypothetical protein SBA2_170009 [Acidobacteriia bacterium SbA2]|nr:hypothetical protein SBA2_170009 [Acidobacteriia bacterium SbA2]
MSRGTPCGCPERPKGRSYKMAAATTADLTFEGLTNEDACVDLAVSSDHVLVGPRRRRPRGEADNQDLSFLRPKSHRCTGRGRRDAEDLSVLFIR